MENQDGFNGFMPMIESITIAKEQAMLASDASIVYAHTFILKTKDGSEHVYSISNDDLMRLSFLIIKTING